MLQPHEPYGCNDEEVITGAYRSLLPNDDDVDNNNDIEGIFI